MSKAMKTQETQFANFTIRYNGSNAIAFNKNDKSIKKSFKGLDTLNQAKSWIGSRHRGIKFDNNNIIKASINFNPHFVNTFAEGEEVIYTHLYTENDNLFFNFYKDKPTDRHTIIMSIELGKLRGNLTYNQFKKLNIPSNARYLIEEVSYNKYQLIFESEVMSKSEHIIFKQPAGGIYTYPISK